MMKSDNFIIDQDFGKKKFDLSAFDADPEFHTGSNKAEKQDSPRKENKVHQVRAQKQQPKEDVPMYNTKRKRFKIDQLPPTHTIHYLLHQTQVEQIM